MPIFPLTIRRSRPAPVGRCMVCGRTVTEADERLRLRGTHVHRSCATYRMRREAGRPTR
jgi:hypothetical protein